MKFARTNLRPVNTGDAELTRNWRNSERVRMAMFDSRPVAADDHAKWLRRICEDEDRHYFIYEFNKMPIGLIGIIWNDRKAGRAEWSFYRGAADAPKGSGLHMLHLALDRYFTDMNGRKMCAEVLGDNTASLAAHEKVGFRREGLRRKHVWHDGTFKDVVEYGLLIEEWKKLSA